MGTVAEYQYAECRPPRRGATWALTVDATARAYDISKCNLGGFTPPEDHKTTQDVFLYLQAETNDVYFYFSDATASNLDNTAAQAATSADLSFATTHGALLKAGNAPLKLRITRSVDKFLIVKAASTSGVLRMWAGNLSA